jgi:hypothetical protein
MRVYHSSLLKLLIDVYETWHEHYTTKGHPNLAILSFLQSVTTAQTRKLLRWERH